MTPGISNCTLPIRYTILLLFFLPAVILAQETICYPLYGGLQASDNSSPELIALSNTQGQSGAFVTTPLPPNLCPGGGNTTAYHFANNAGLAFNNNTAELIDCDYTVEFTVNFEELPANGFFDSPWIWVFGTYNDDDGIFIWRDIISGRLYLEFWDSNTRLKTVPFDAFNTTDWFRFTITRNCAGQVRVYINCAFFTDFNDTRNILRLHPSTGNTMIFFQDDPSILVGDSAPGKVRDIRISNYIKDQATVTEECDCLCENMAAECTVEITRDSFVCDPDLVDIKIDTIPFSRPCACNCDSIITTNYLLLPAEECMTPCEEVVSSDTLLCPGSFFHSVVILQDTTICDTTLVDPNCLAIRCTNIELLPIFAIALDTFICTGESVQVGTQTFTATGTYEVMLTAANGCDSIVAIDLKVIEGQPITVDTLLCPGAFLENILILNDTSFCRTISGAQGCETMLCYNVQVYPTVITQLQEEICPGGTFIFGDTLLTFPGFYSRRFIGQHGCDSLVQLRLDTIATPTIIQDTTLCFGTVFAGAIILRDTFICETVPDVQTCALNRCYRVKADTAYIFERRETVCLGSSFVLGDSSYTAPGTYLHHYKTISGCDSLIVLILDQRPPLPVSISGSPTLCPGKTNALNAGSGFVAYQWTPTGETTQIIQPKTPGTYIVRATDSFGCQSEDSIAVVASPPVLVDIEVLQQELCPESEDAILQANIDGGTIPYTIRWSDGSDTPTLSGISAGRYTVQVRDGQDCVSTDTVVLSPIVGFDIDIASTPPSCSDNPDGSIRVHASNGSGPFLYEINNQGLSVDSIFSGLLPGTYTLSVEDINGCRQEEVVFLEAENSIQLTIFPATAGVQYGDSITLILQPENLSADIASISWSPVGILDCATCPAAIAAPTTDTTISVVVTLKNGCSLSAYSQIQVVQEHMDSTGSKHKFYAPTAFSPNDDGVNDVFRIYPGKEVTEIRYLMIFDRWGENVLALDNLPVGDLSLGWDGRKAGQQLPSGIYIWLAELRYENESIEHISGNVLLIR